MDNYNNGEVNARSAPEEKGTDYSVRSSTRNAESADVEISRPMVNGVGASLNGKLDLSTKTYPSPPESEDGIASPVLVNEGVEEDQDCVVRSLPTELQIDPQELLELASIIQVIPQETGFLSILPSFLLDMTFEFAGLFWFFLSTILWPRSVQLGSFIAALLTLLYTRVVLEISKLRQGEERDQEVMSDVGTEDNSEHAEMLLRRRLASATTTMDD